MVIGWLTFGLSALTLIILPALVIMYKGMLKWTRVENKLETLIRDVQTLVKDKDRSHQEIISTQREDRIATERVHQELTQMQREDRHATDRRLRYLEETIWREQGGRRRGGNVAS
jgi:hypothetical protein